MASIRYDALMDETDIAIIRQPGLGLVLGAVQKQLGEALAVLEEMDQ